MLFVFFCLSLFLYLRQIKLCLAFTKTNKHPSEIFVYGVLTHVLFFSGADWRLFAQRVGIPEEMVSQWHKMKVQQPMRNVLGVWAASNAATVRMLHRHLVSPQMRCVVLGRRISDAYQVD